MVVAPRYPVQVAGRLDPKLSRWLWLVNRLLVIPHVIVLVFLWVAFVVLSVIAFFAILFTERYPRGSSTSISAASHPDNMPEAPGRARRFDPAPGSCRKGSCDVEADEAPAVIGGAGAASPWPKRMGVTLRAG